MTGASRSEAREPRRGAVGDLDGDGDPDIFTANVGVLGDEPNRVWLNGEEPLFPVKASVVSGLGRRGARDLDR